MSMPAKKAYFSEEDIEKLQKGYSEVKAKYEALLLKFTMRAWQQEKAKEFAIHGFTRRLGIMRRCIDNIYQICPPDLEIKPTQEELKDISINLHAFIVNVYGALDNLAWIWIEEKKVLNNKGQSFSPKEVGFAEKYKDFRNSLPQNIQNYLNEDRHKNWFSYLEEFRHSLAHRIPLYVVPYVLNEEEIKKTKELEGKKTQALKAHKFDEYERLSAEADALGRFVPWMTHSFGENSPQAVFSVQILADWNTVEEIATKFMDEFKIPSSPSP